MALNIFVTLATGDVLGKTTARHTSAEFVDFQRTPCDVPIGTEWHDYLHLS
jgi:hypothetical protein